MSKAYMKFYIGDYSADTRGLNATEHGVYLLLLMEQWERERLPSDRKLLYKLCLARTPQVRACVDHVIERFFSYDETSKSFFSVRLRRELSKFKEGQGKQQWSYGKGVKKQSTRARESESKRERDYSTKLNNLSLSHVDSTSRNTAGSALASASAGGPASPSPSPACQSKAPKQGPAEVETPRLVTINGVSVPWSELPDRVDKGDGNGVDTATQETLRLLDEQLTALEKEATDAN